MTPLEVGLTGFVVLGVLIYLGMHISSALLLVAFVGTWVVRGDIDLAGRMLGLAATDAVAEYEFGTVPLFVLMGFFVMVSGVGRDTYLLAHRMLRRVPGGLGQATVVGNALFSAVTGITVAAVVMFTKLAVPEMLKRGYHPRLAVGVVAGSAMLGMLIPPSVLMIIYAVLTDTSVGDIYLAGIVPGIVLTLAFCGAIYVIARLKPQWTGRGPGHGPESGEPDSLLPNREILHALTPVIVLIALVLGGMYGGAFTATEAGAVGAAGSLVIALLRRSLSWPVLWAILIDTAHVTASLILIVAAATIFTRFQAISGLPSAISQFVSAHSFTILELMTVYVLLVLLLGTALDSGSTVLIAVPIFAPVFAGLGADLVWLGVITMIAVEIGLITPPLGLSPFVVKASLAAEGLGKDIRLRDIYIGAMPFAVAAMLVVVLLVLFPAMTLMTK